MFSCFIAVVTKCFLLYCPENRRQMLQKWKAERELKKKLQQREQGKKPMFRVTHVVPETVPFDKPLPKVISLPDFLKTFQELKKISTVSFGFVSLKCYFNKVIELTKGLMNVV